MTSLKLDADGFSEWCAGELRDARAPSLSVAVGIDGEIAFAEAFGFANTGELRAATTETAYLLASITKPITAVSVCLLADRKQLQLDAPVESYLDGLRFARPGGGGSPTVRQVLQHTAGLGQHAEFFYVDTDGPRRSFADTMQRYGTLYADPGTRYCYSNLGYGILDEVIRNVAGRAPEDFVRSEVFLPLGMHSAHIGAGYPEGEAKAATRYTLEGDALPVYDMCHRGASEAWMTASDLVRFGLSQAGGATVLSREMSQTMLAGGVPISDAAGVDDEARYALGWMTWRADGYEFVEHSGGMPGVSTRLCVIPEQRLAIAVLCNCMAVELPDLADRVMNHLLASLLPSYSPRSPSKTDRETDPELHGEWSGRVTTYAGDIPLTLRIDPGGKAAVALDDSSFIDGVIEPAAATWQPPEEIVARVHTQLPTPDAHVRSPHLTLYLRRSAAGLCGAAVAGPPPDAAAHGDGRFGNIYSHWCELTRAA
jgi:CubicO group peptidase (beta-lactamase class C family)